jgi:pantothenate kinase
MAGGQRKLLGLAGAPGAGKSTLAAALLEAVGADRAQVVPMDGFHLANVELQRLGRAARKGAPDTFDSAGYVALLQRLREQRPDGGIVYAPEFRREIEEPVAGAIAVLPTTQLVITEGNYLLHDAGPGPALRRCSTRSGTWTSTTPCAKRASCGATSSSAAAPRRRAPGSKAPTRPTPG